MVQHQVENQSIMINSERVTEFLLVCQELMMPPHGGAERGEELKLMSSVGTRPVEHLRGTSCSPVGGQTGSTQQTTGAAPQPATTDSLLDSFY